MTTETAAKKDTQKLQRAIVDGLEDVKAQDIVVFNTEHLSALFERVIICTGSSNRQTKALAASVRDAVREEGFPKPRIEGEDNGEWIIVDCGAAVVHIMQAAIRQYYTLEEIWGDKPVRLKFGTSKPAMPEAPPVEPKAKGKKLPEPTLRRSSAAKTAIKVADAERKLAKAPAKKVSARNAGAKRPAAPRVAQSSIGSAAKAPRAPQAAAKAIAKPVVKPARNTSPKTSPKTSAKSANPARKSPAAPRARKPASK